VRVFYANALPGPITEPFLYKTYVRGRTIFFNRDAITQYLGNPYELADSEDLCEYHERLKNNTLNHS